MKVVNKARIKHRRYEKLTLSEKDILAQIHSNYIVCLKYAYHTPIDVYLVLDLMTGILFMTIFNIYIHIYLYTLAHLIHTSYVYTHTSHTRSPYICTPYSYTPISLRILVCTCLFLSYIYTLYTHIHVIYTHLIHTLLPYIHILIIHSYIGGDLGYQLTKQGKFTMIETQYYISRILLGLAALHEKRIVYRDLKVSLCVV